MISGSTSVRPVLSSQTSISVRQGERPRIAAASLPPIPLRRPASHNSRVLGIGALAFSRLLARIERGVFALCFDWTRLALREVMDYALVEEISAARFALI